VEGDHSGQDSNVNQESDPELVRVEREDVSGFNFVDDETLDEVIEGGDEVNLLDVLDNFHAAHTDEGALDSPSQILRKRERRGKFFFRRRIRIRGWYPVECWTLFHENSAEHYHD
jgi:hypothetical protein